MPEAPDEMARAMGLPTMDEIERVARWLAVNHCAVKLVNVGAERGGALFIAWPDEAALPPELRGVYGAIRALCGRR
jgi:hypothetical protein